MFEITSVHVHFELGWVKSSQSQSSQFFSKMTYHSVCVCVCVCVYVSMCVYECVCEWVSTCVCMWVSDWLSSMNQWAVSDSMSEQQLHAVLCRVSLSSVLIESELYHILTVYGWRLSTSRLRASIWTSWASSEKKQTGEKANMKVSNEVWKLIALRLKRENESIRRMRNLQTLHIKSFCV